MLSDKQKKIIVGYYRKPESLLGYRHYLWGSKHFGYYPGNRADISEREAQDNLHELVAKKLSLRPRQKVFDAGCGEGLAATYLAGRFNVNVHGVTLVPFEKRKAAARAHGLGLESLTNFKIMDYTHTSFPNDFFDAVYTTESLSHIPEPAEALKEFFRILKPGGRLALFEYTIAPDNKFSRYEFKMLNLVIEESGMFGLKKIRHDRLPKTLSQVGFSDVRQENISVNILPSFKRLYTSALGPYRIVKKLRMRKIFLNTTASVEYFKMARKDLIRYYIFTAKKPGTRRRRKSNLRRLVPVVGATRANIIS